MGKQNLSDPITLRIPLDVLSDIEAIAEATERSRSWVIVRALRTYLLNEGADVLAFRQGQQEIANGDYEDVDDVLADMMRIASEKVA
ncbi:ribbon-helix-helix protein, CopG family [Ensifer sp. NBAIM29]|nr:ribbon-helix-helix protein, CopG family [Bradyrhizobium sp. BRP14]MCA1494793.1 ribbon-helix-helix protein, CopG family [Ensifer sp. NBAIM29]